MPKLQKIQTGDRVINMIQDNISNILDVYSSAELAQGQILKNVVLASGDNSIAHKLNRKLLGWFVVRLRAAATIYDKQDTNPSPATFLILNASAGVTVDLYVF